MKVNIRDMVSNRCKSAVKEVFEKLGMQVLRIELGEVEITEDIPLQTYSQLKINLKESGFELMEDKQIILAEKIKTLIIELIYYNEYTNKVNLSDYLTNKLNYDYTYLSNLFSVVHGDNLEHFMISHRIERIKELLKYDELTI